MITLVTLGNGFDLHAGMKTSFRDYLSLLKSKYCKEYAEIQNGLADAMNHGFVIPDGQESVLRNTQANAWALMFLALICIEEKAPSLLEGTELDEWQDIERLLLFLTQDRRFCWKEIIYFLDVSHQAIEDGERLSPSDLFRRRDPLLLARVVGAVLRHKNRICENLLSGKRENVVRFLLDELNCFETDFGQYIYMESSRCGSESRRDLFNRIISNEHDGSCYIDSFNYCESWYRETRYVNGDWKQPIIGIDEQQLEANSVWLPLSKGSRRLYVDSARLSGSKTFLIPNRWIIYGHSLNAQDYSYFFNLFDAMKLTDSTQGSKVEFCYSKYGNKSEAEAKEELIQRIITLFAKYDEAIALRGGPLRTLTQLEVGGRIRIREV